MRVTAAETRHHVSCMEVCYEYMVAVADTVTSLHQTDSDRERERCAAREKYDL